MASFCLCFLFFVDALSLSCIQKKSLKKKCVVVNCTSWTLLMTFVKCELLIRTHF